MSLQNAGQLVVGQGVRVKVPAWMMSEKSLASRVIEGTIEAVTGKAILVNGHAASYPSDHCHRCGQQIVNMVSRMVGYGPICSDYLGIPRDFPAERVAEYRAKITKDTAIKTWLPLSCCQVEVVTDVAEEVKAAAETKRKAEQAAKNKVRISVEQDRIVVRSPIEAKDWCKSVQGGWWSKPVQWAWNWFITPKTAEALHQVFAGSPFTVEEDAAFKQLLVKAEAHRGALQTAAEQKVADVSTLAPIALTKTAPWGHQLRAYNFSLALPGAALLMDMGTGKSKVAVDLICNREQAFPALIVCPLSVVGVWPKQFKVHAGKEVEVVTLNGKLSVAQKRDRAHRAIEEARVNGRNLVLVINYESAWREPFAEWALGVKWGTVLLDESHKVKAPGGQASKFCGKLAAQARWRLILTGTPMPHSPLDVYSQYRFLDRDVFPRTFNQFKHRYAVMGGYMGYEIEGWQNLDELNSLMYSVAFRVTKDILDLPEYTHVTRSVFLGAEARRAYTALAEQLVADVGAGKVTASNVLTRLLRLQQITSGYVRTDASEESEGGEVQVDTAKEDTLAEVLEGIGKDEPVAVFARFHHDLDTIKRVAEKLGRRYGELSGRSRDGLAEDATMKEEVDVLGVQISSGGVGIDLTRARYAVYYSVGFSLGDYEQSLARVHRPGQTKPVTYIHLVTAHSIDETVYENLQNKRDVVESVMAEVAKALAGGNSNEGNGAAQAAPGLTTDAEANAAAVADAVEEDDMAAWMEVGEE